MMALENKLVAYFKENVEDLHDLVRQLNSYDGSLEELSFWENNEEFFSIFFEGVNPIDVAKAVCYGSYRYTDEYVNFDALGNLVSMDGWQLEELLLENVKDIVAEFVEYHLDNNSIWLNGDIDEMVELYREG